MFSDYKDDQWYINQVRLHGSRNKAALANGIPRSTFKDRMSKANNFPPFSATVEHKKIFVIPDVQAKPNVPLDHMTWAGKYIADKRPDIIVQIGDFADMPSLSLYDKGKRTFEGRRYKADVAAAHDAMERLMTPIVQATDYNPELVLTLGNHEDRINRATLDDAKLDGTISIHDLGYADWGWSVHDFKDVVDIQGIHFSHFFYNPNSGHPWAGNAHTKLKNIGFSFVMGHQQGFDMAWRQLANGRRQLGMVAGSFYQHDEEYRGAQANNEWRGCVMLSEAKNGEADVMQISLDYLRRRYG